MRHWIKPAQLGTTAIETLIIDPKSRDDIEAVLRGLQHLYVRHWQELEAIFDEEFCPDVDWSNGRPGMDVWSILVAGVLKQGIGCDFDRLRSLVNHHGLVRTMMGHDDGFARGRYEFPTLVDNVALLTPALLERVGPLLVASGHKVARKKPGAVLRGRVDSFCVETDVHYPTDVHLLWDAVRSLVRIATREAQRHGLSGWRQSRHVQTRLRQGFHRVRIRRRQTPKRVRAYRRLGRRLITQADRTRAGLIMVGAGLGVSRMNHFRSCAVRLMDPVERRLLKGGIIPQDEKLFSVFEPHTRWVAKGKAGRPVELGVPVGILEDQHQFLLHHAIMWEGHDVDYAVPMVQAAQAQYPDLRECSFDRGFHSPANRRTLDALLDVNALPTKGYRSAAAREREAEVGFATARHQHPAVESAIHHLEHRGLDRVRSHGRDGFAQTVALAVLAANGHRLGRLIRQLE